MGEPSGDSPVWCLQLYLRIEHELSAQDAQFLGTLQPFGQGNHRGALQDGDAVCFRLVPIPKALPTPASEVSFLPDNPMPLFQYHMAFMGYSQYLSVLI